MNDPYVLNGYAPTRLVMKFRWSGARSSAGSSVETRLVGTTSRIRTPSTGARFSTVRSPNASWISSEAIGSRSW